MSEVASRTVPTGPSNARSHSQLDASKNLRPGRDLMEYVQRFAREKPDVAALWCFGIGVVVGWKLKPW
jgi:hypothetical protein